MSEDFTYHDYVNDEKFLEQYNAYQTRHAIDIRESDKIIISMVGQLVEQAKGRRLKVLDIGCSTGNLLMHLKRLVPEADYTGGIWLYRHLKRAGPTQIFMVSISKKWIS